MERERRRKVSKCIWRRGWRRTVMQNNWRFCEEWKNKGRIILQKCGAYGYSLFNFSLSVSVYTHTHTHTHTQTGTNMWIKSQQSWTETEKRNTAHSRYPLYCCPLKSSELYWWSHLKHCLMKLQNIYTSFVLNHWFGFCIKLSNSYDFSNQGFITSYCFELWGASQMEGCILVRMHRS